MKRITIWTILCLALTAALALPASAEMTPEENPFLGRYTLKTVYLAPVLSISPDAHAQKMDGTTAEVSPEIFQMDEAEGLAPSMVPDPIYRVDKLDALSREEAFASLLMDDASLLLDFDTRLTFTDGAGNPQNTIFFAKGNEIWMFRTGTPDATGRQMVLYAYALTRE